MSASHEQQAAELAAKQPVRAAVLTVSDTRTAADDEGGDLVVSLAQAAGHRVVVRALVRDDAPRIEEQIKAWLADPGVDAILITGGTGIAKRDTTIDVVRRLLTVELEGYGELFRMLSYEQVKAAAMMSRAVGGLTVKDPGAGVGCDTFIFAMPGSVNAVRTAMTNLIGPQLAHLVWERRRQG